MSYNKDSDMEKGYTKTAPRLLAWKRELGFNRRLSR